MVKKACCTSIYRGEEKLATPPLPPSNQKMGLKAQASGGWSAGEGESVQFVKKCNSHYSDQVFIDIQQCQWGNFVIMHREE